MENLFSVLHSQGRHKKTVFFFGKTPKGGGGSRRIRNFLIRKKLRYFWNFFWKEGGVPPIPKGCYHKKWGYWGIFAKKGGSHPIHRDFIKKKLRIFWNFSPKGGGVSPIPKFPYQKKTRASKMLEGGGGVSGFRSFSERKKNSFFLLMPPLISPALIECRCLHRAKFGWSNISDK